MIEPRSENSCWYSAIRFSPCGRAETTAGPSPGRRGGSGTRARHGPRLPGSPVSGPGGRASRVDTGGMLEFELYPQLAADAIPIAEWSLSSVRLLDNARLPRIVLVPRRPGAWEIHRRALADRDESLREIVRVSEALDEVARPGA